LYYLLLIGLKQQVFAQSNDVTWTVSHISSSEKIQDVPIGGNYGYRYNVSTESGSFSSNTYVGNKRTNRGNSSTVKMTNSYRRILLKLDFISVNQAFEEIYKIVQNLLTYTGTKGYSTWDESEINLNSSFNHLDILLVKSGFETNFQNGLADSTYAAYSIKSYSTSLVTQAPLDATYSLPNNTNLKQLIESKLNAIPLNQNGTV